MIIVKVVHYDQRNILNFFISCPHFDIWRQTAVTLPFFSNFLTSSSFYVTSTWLLSNVDHGKSCKAWSEKHFERIFFFTSCPVFDVWHHKAVIFPFFSNSLTSSSFYVTLIWFLIHVIWIKVVQHDQRHFEKNSFSCPNWTYEAIQPSFCRFK